jgi:hypothetical protein
MTMMTRTKTIDERFEEARAQLEGQTAAWNEARASLAALGDTRLLVPAASLAAIDAVVRRARVIAGGVMV